ncbi:prepilin-type N-terminal cleavage/methylation domain-containing protein [Ornithinibacillus salinisoli]|uniref:Prepilin-type N-terminal cleavage/methylation domain-containing protein n=1 Tax=Ornithinibacillus salinisoli TaxID=1848459 RepID=A0ABW4W2X6_9BACI
MKKNDGFSFIEVLISLSIVLLIISTVVPINSLVDKERTTLKERRVISLRLHDELQLILWDKDVQYPKAKEILIDNTSYQFLFSKENNYLKGCVEWKNAKKQADKLCLYGLPQ